MSDVVICSIDEEGRYGGPQRRVVEIAKGLKKHGIETLAVYPVCDSERYAHELSIAGIKKTPLKLTRLTLEKKILIKYIFTFIADILRIYSFLKKHKINLVQINGTPQYKGILAAKMAGIPAVWVIEDTKMPFLVKETCMLLARCFAAGIVVTGKKVYDYYIRESPLESIKCTEIHAPVDTNIFNPDCVKPDRRMDQAQNRKIITVSGISPVKGLEYFIEMASELLRKHDDLLFFVAGAELSSQVKYNRFIKNLIASKKLTGDNYFYCGMINDVPSFLQGGDIFVCTSISEAGPMTVWEAMAMGKAIVTTEVGAVRQYIEDGVSGFIVPPMDSRALSVKVAELLNNPTLCEKMGAEARLVAKNKLDVSIAAEKYDRFYRSILLRTRRHIQGQ